MIGRIVDIRSRRVDPDPPVDRTDPRWDDALAYLRSRPDLDRVNVSILNAYLAGAKAEREARDGN